MASLEAVAASMEPYRLPFVRMVKRTDPVPWRLPQDLSHYAATQQTISLLRASTPSTDSRMASKRRLLEKGWLRRYLFGLTKVA